MLLQRLETVAGATYRIEFALAGNPDREPMVKQVLVSAGNDSEVFSFDATGRSRADMGWQRKSFTFTATGASTELSFSSLTGGASGPAIDNVSLRTEFVPLGAEGRGLSIQRAVCRNLTTGQEPVVISDPPSLVIACEEAGLVVNDGDEVKITLRGVAARGGTPPDEPDPVEGTIIFTAVPAYGSHDDLQGMVSGLEPAQYKVAVFIRVRGGWWTKPYWNTPLTSISEDGSFTTDITSGGVDPESTEIFAYVVRAGYAPPLMAGQSTLPASLESDAVAVVRVTRVP
jgi:hypothetical protein